MEHYRFTAYKKTGELLFDEIWNFENDMKAKKEGQKQIEEKGILNQTFRLVHSSGRLVLFHS